MKRIKRLDSRLSGLHAYGSFHINQTSFKINHQVNYYCINKGKLLTLERIRNDVLLNEVVLNLPFRFKG